MAVFIVSDSGRFPGTGGDGNWASLNSVEPVSRLLWRSSKLTDGRKSKDEVVSPRSADDAGAFRLDENRGWVLVDAVLSIGSSVEGCWGGDGGFDRFAKSRVLSGRQRVSESYKRCAVGRPREEFNGNKGKTNDIPSRRGVVCWPWSSGPLMLSKHKGYLVATDGEGPNSNVGSR